MQAVVLCGGFGTRLSSVVKDVPKPMAPIKNTPFLLYLYKYLKKHGYTKFLFLTGYKSEVIEEFFSDYDDVSFLRENQPLGTGGALLNAYNKRLLDETFLLVNGDTFFNTDLLLLMSYHKENSITIGLKFTSDVSRYGCVLIDEDEIQPFKSNIETIDDVTFWNYSFYDKSSYLVHRFIEKGNLPPRQIDCYINSGSYIISSSVLDLFAIDYNKSLISLENDILPLLINEKKVYALPLGGDFIDIGIPNDYFKAQEFIPNSISSKSKPAIFIDKDGTLINDYGYTHGKKIEPIINILSFVKEKNKNKEYLLIIVTNQAGVAKNKFTEIDMNDNIESVIEFYKKNGIEFADVEYCTYCLEATLEEYKYKSLCRKPSPGMLLKASEKFNIDLKNSLMIGDNEETDVIKLPYVKSLIIDKSES
jgi:D,D-heptose 1,7-bisphosphate phosphatase